MTTRTLFFTLLFAVSSTKVLLALGGENGLENFLTEKMKDYPDWVQDPSSPRTEGLSFYTEGRLGVNITAQLRNLYVSGHSANSQPPDTIKAELDKKEFYICRNTTTTLAGKYTATGKVKASTGRVIPFSGQGKFKIGVEDDFVLNIECIQIKEYAVTAEGYLDIMAGKIIFLPNAPAGWEVLEFEGLLDDPELTSYTREILQTIWSELFNNDDLDSIHPSGFLLAEYLNLIFGQHKYEEIVGWL